MNGWWLLIVLPPLADLFGWAGHEIGRLQGRGSAWLWLIAIKTVAISGGLIYWAVG